MQPTEQRRSLYARSRRTWTAEFAGKGIRANMISPGPTETPILEGQFGANADAMRERFKTMIPMGRMAEAQRHCFGSGVPGLRREQLHHWNRFAG